MEVWKEIKEVNGRYSISNLGRIKCNGYYTNHISGKRWVKEKIRTISNPKGDYSRITLEKSFQTTMHRLVAKYFIPNPNNFEFVNHKDGNKHNYSIENLEWVTRLENENHAFLNGLKNSTGSANKMSKLTESDVLEIRKLQGIFSANKLEKKFNVHRATIQRIWNRKIWTHI
jgi:hypothetical protein